MLSVIVRSSKSSAMKSTEEKTLKDRIYMKTIFKE